MKDGLITLNLGGKERTLKFNMRALEVLSEAKCAGDFGISSVSIVVYAGLIGWHYAKQMDPDFTFEEVSDWVEELTMSEDAKVLSGVNECFENSRAFKYVSENAKKKVARSNGQISMPTPGEQSALSPESITNLPNTSM
jgi:hypothetical protein